ncbi:hypothetical protein ACOME3_001396 [Neoechinorhynchus agilis]
MSNTNDYALVPTITDNNAISAFDKGENEPILSSNTQSRMNEIKSLIDLTPEDDDDQVLARIQDITEECKILKEKQERYAEERSKFIEGITELKSAYAVCKIKWDESKQEVVDLKNRIERLSNETTELRISKLKMEHSLGEQNTSLQSKVAQLQRKLDDKEEIVELEKAASLSEYMQKTEEYFGGMLDSERNLFKIKEESMKSEIESRQMMIDSLEKEKMDNVKLVASLRRELENGRKMIGYLQSASEEDIAAATMSNPLVSLHEFSVQSVEVQTEDGDTEMSTEFIVNTLTSISPTNSTDSNNDYVSSLKAEIANLRNERDRIIEKFNKELECNQMGVNIDDILELRSRMHRIEIEKQTESEAWRRLLNRAILNMETKQFSGVFPDTKAEDNNGPIPRLLIEQRYRCELGELQRDRMALANRLRAEQVDHSREIALLRVRLEAVSCVEHPFEPVNLEYIRAVLIRCFSSSEPSVRRTSLNALTMILGCTLEERYALLRIFDHAFTKINLPSVAQLISRNYVQPASRK